MRRWLVVVLAGFLPACSSDGETSDGTDEDSGTEEEVDAGDAGEDCPSGGEGSLVVDVTIDDGLRADVRVQDATGDFLDDGFLSESTTLTVPAGWYRITAARVSGEGVIVNPAYQGGVDHEEVCVRDGQASDVQVLYAREPGSEKLWLTNGNGQGQVLAFDGDALESAGDQAPSVTLDAKRTSPTALAVDGQGWLWIGDRTGSLVGFKSERLGSSSSTAPDVVLEGDALCGDTLPCGPRALAFDVRGNLWAATLKRIVMIGAASLEASGSVTAEVTIESPDATRPMALAFDQESNLWVGDEETDAVVKFSAARLVENIEGAADVVIKAKTPPPVIGDLRAPEGLVFDSMGNLWVGYFAGNNLVRLTPSDLEASATLTPPVQFAIDVLALVTDLAIDNRGNLWMPGAQGSLYRIDAAELANEEPQLTALRSTALGSAARLALNSVPGPLFITR